ncbi:DUF2269 family protein [Geodermatophilus ruber]|uniref:Predicted integral membrane protein n=1 Tax=Geodermatophilus ruber TaxID=504800 RepID=A0A1I4JSZ9_9ACTN|nr:DUF2269 family protein [Geodermatophilus ruber]SFL69337.1 Predicted integral membrane protein [Geodermatophilus ruber]
MGTVLTVLHVVTAVFLVGPMALLPQTALRAVRAGSAPAVELLTRSTKVVTWASLAVAVLGFGISGIEGIPLSRTWLWISIVLYLVALVLSLVLVIPSLTRAVAALQRDPSSAKALYGRIAAGSGIVSLLLLAVTVLMVWKP